MGLGSGGSKKKKKNATSALPTAAGLPPTSGLPNTGLGATTAAPANPTGLPGYSLTQATGKKGKKGRTTLTTPTGTITLGKDASQTAALADYQGALNQKAIDTQTEANRANQVNPWGEVKWTQDPTTKEWTQTTTLTPAEQAALESQQRVKQGLSGTAENMLGVVGGKYGQEMDWSGFTPRGEVATAPGMENFRQTGEGPDFQQAAGGPSWQELADLGGGGVAGTATAGQTTAERAKEYELQKQLDMSGLSPLAQADPETRKRVEDALYEQMKSRLDPQWQQRETQMLDRLYAMGAREGDPLFGSQFGDLGRERNDAYNQAMWQSITGGGEEMQRLFDMQMGNRQQTWQEALGQGQFTNEALMNQFQQGAFNTGQANQVGMANAANTTQAGIANAGNQTQASLANAANRLKGAELGLTYGLESADLNNRYAQQGWENQRMGAQDWNDLVQQAYGNQRTQTGDINAQRAAQIEEALMQRNQPLNELTALLSGQQVNAPQFGGYSQAGSAEAADIYGGVMDQRAQNAAEKNARNQMYAGLASGAMGMFSFSDRRLKSNIVRIGTTPGGYGWYEYDIFGRREQGVMADEVPAEWTALHPSGYMMVDYARVQ